MNTNSERLEETQATNDGIDVVLMRCRYWKLEEGHWTQGSGLRVIGGVDICQVVPALSYAQVGRTH